MADNTLLWAEKYEPKTINDLIVNKPIIQKIKLWLESFNKNNYCNIVKQNETFDTTINTSSFASTIIITGPRGCGKNTSIKILLNEYNYDVKILSSSNVKNQKVIDDIITSYERRKKMANLFNNIKNGLALIIDDTETINLTNEKNSLLDLCKSDDGELQLSKQKIPIIFIANTQKGKLIANIQKLCTTYEFLQPTKIDMTNIMIKIMTNEDMKVANQKIIDIIIEYSQYDIRRMIYILQDLKSTFLNKKNIIITQEDIEQFHNNFQKKDVEISLFDATKYLLNNYKSINQCMNLYEVNKVTLPLAMHENYYRKLFAASKYLNLTKTNPDKLLLMQLDIAKKITNASSLGDNIETNIYIDQNWINQNIHGLYTVADISYIMNSNIESLISTETPQQKKMIKESDFEICHSLDLHKTSLKNINKKQINILKSYIPNKTLIDILYINKIIYDLIKNEKYKEAYNLCNDYGIDIKTLEIIIKIDKTSDKLNIKTKNKKQYC